MYKPKYVINPGKRGDHTDIPWSPLIPHEVYEGYVEFAKRQQTRLTVAARNQRRVLIKC